MRSAFAAAPTAGQTSLLSLARLPRRSSRIRRERERRLEGSPASRA